ncbi:MAG: hypothetical protein KGI78_03090 [Patescibacteria group bacterium]|nr:hypothetical protein [Patescibacteria group bacterium]MDE1944237.1 hypothetical protein [Patescibacteria group bacterium]MDE1945327.1 hypothetical protein [Patescibacteria group bacterium]MDE2057815.1 hypothetical protein [Patescibacteria group bacterium]
MSRHVPVNREKLKELLDLADEARPIADTTERQAVRDRASQLAREAFYGYVPGIEPDNMRRLLLWEPGDGERRSCVGASFKSSPDYNPGIDWLSVGDAVRALWIVDEKVSPNPIFSVDIRHLAFEID